MGTSRTTIKTIVTSRWPDGLSRALFLTIAAAILATSPGCQDVEWNWDTTWWRRPQRTVRPTPTRPAAGSRGAIDEEREDAAASRIEGQSGRRASSDGEARGPAGGSGAPPSEQAGLDGRPFFNLYLRNTPLSEGEQPRGETSVQLASASPRTCARALELLYVPMGRSGSPTETYLIYENRAEFAAALRFASRLDEAASTAPPAAAGAESSFRAGVAQFMAVIEFESIVDASLIDSCERSLGAAAQSGELPALDRWAAAILAGRLMCDYRYDYVAARSYFRQAERLVPADSLEAMTAQWCRADSFTREGKTGEAAVACDAIVSSFGDRWPASRIVRQAREIFAKQGGR